MVKVKTGSALEGKYLGSGISHLLEHMIFKGTATRPVGTIEKEVKSYGGVINGSASHDLTDFYIVLPSEYLPQAIAILKDMLLNAAIDPSELAREKDVVLKEMRMNRDEPESRLLDLLNKRAYIEHAYKFPTIGYEEQLKGLTRDDLVDYYTTRYVPNRMIVTIVGGIDASAAISMVEREFKGFRASNYGVVDAIRPEPPQIQPRALDEDMDTNLAYIAMGFHSTSLLNKDLFAMDVLSMILGRGDNSRLNTVLYKNKGLVHSISAWNYTPRDPGLFVITAVLDKNMIAPAEDQVMTEIKRLQNMLVDPKELAAAKRTVLADFISTFETIDGQAGVIASNYALAGSEDFFTFYVKGINSVTREDVKRVANLYLRPENLTTARIRPRSKESAPPTAVRTRPPEQVKAATLANGLKIFVRHDAKIPMISITAAMIGGTAVEDKANNGISNMTADLILRSTRMRPGSDKIKGKLQDLGGDITQFSGVNTFGVTASVLKPDLDQALDTIREVLVNADFPDEEIEKSRSFVIAAIKSENDDIFAVGLNRLKKELFGDSPYSLRALGDIRTILLLKRSAIEAFYKKYYIPNNMVIAVSGDIDPDAVINKIRERFDGLAREKLSLPAIPATIVTEPKTTTISMNKEQALLFIGFRSVPRRDPDRYPLEVLGGVLSGSSGRLFDELRNKLSLAYTLGCVQEFWTDEGIFAFYVATTKENLEKSRTALIQEIKSVKDTDISDSELEEAKRELVSRYRLASQTNGFYSLNLALEELRGLGYDNIYKYEDSISRVTKGDVRRVAGRYLDMARSAEVRIEPKQP